MQEVAKEGLSVKHQEHAGVGVQKHVKQKASGGNTAEDAVQQKPADSKMKKRKPSEDEEASTSNAERAVKQRSHKKKTKKRRTGGEKEARAIEKEAAGGASPAGAAEQGKTTAFFPGQWLSGTPVTQAFNDVLPWQQKIAFVALHSCWTCLCVV